MRISSFKSKILDIIPETPTVWTFRMERPDSFEYMPGQSCIIAYPDRSVPGKRQYSFSSSGLEKGFFDITVKVYGEFTRKMFSLQKGFEFEVKGPFGKDFVVDESTRDHLMFLAGGVGITPFLSILRYASVKKMPNDLLLFFSAKTENEIIAKADIDRIAASSNNIVPVYTLTRSGWGGETGRITEPLIRKYVKRDLSHYTCFICGPNDFIESMKNLLSHMSSPPQKIVIEDWGI